MGEFYARYLERYAILSDIGERTTPADREGLHDIAPASDAAVRSVHSRGQGTMSIHWKAAQSALREDSEQRPENRWSWEYSFLDNINMWNEQVAPFVRARVNATG